MPSNNSYVGAFKSATLFCPSAGPEWQDQTKEEEGIRAQWRVAMPIASHNPGSHS